MPCWFRLKMPAVTDDDRDDLPRFASYLHWRLPEPRLKWLKENNQWRPLVRAYLASVSYVDAQIGRVLSALSESGRVRSHRVRRDWRCAWVRRSGRAASS